MRWFDKHVLVLVVITILFPTVVYAASTSKDKSLGSYGAWRAFAYDEGGQTVCYMVTTKTIKTTGPKKRGLPYLMISHRPIEASTDVISYGAGTMLDEKRGVKMTIAASVFDLFSVRDIAWARDARTDHKIATAIRVAASLQTYALSAKKPQTKIVDQFDLTGAMRAYRAIGKACGLPDAEAKITQTSKSGVTKTTKSLNHH